MANGACVGFVVTTQLIMATNKNVPVHNVTHDCNYTVAVDTQNRD